ncbi:MFS transporter [Bradyrhizobium sp. U87765 SZCCT0131]|uniref:MFS transporter n=1 Tax=unclassified Bradyrhizobium TaxID=2631580 RepID=UPI001BAB4EC1|nr:MULTISPECIES: MFS transporter [unclassified Bradyrhizobium]MBR1221063.1 MFS transporter [Bradyrhizobium sp. U87765 SZCCT0131]MBR1260117.1 MFS transporter [Bradyrhizobium sp. U87765 SZCCT0134]MBR1307634.1 MFS transporter [Bradyrhizobium sp. U87765 SZCCT0110]MBR1321588.1 MFS transporter [Bradyrhizobium sp. U87765 SZCCT0109]MBR1349901.1 MFS transporter [Bradyrhizobium sp. U87765 SZCCT0048]
MTDVRLQAAGDFITEDVAHSRVMTKVFRRLIGFLFVAYFFSYLDRINIGFAALSMNKDLALTATMFGFANTLFYLTYMLFEVPSNLLLERFGARIWLARIMVTWGLASTATMFATGPYSLYFVRALVGLAEAGFVPGVILYLSYWFPAAQRARAMALLMMAMPATFMLGSPVSGLILQLHGAFGIAGWRWLFLLEGLPSIILGIVTYFYLTDRPSDARWLTAEERQVIQHALDSEGRTVPAARSGSMWQELLGARVLLLSLGYFCLVTSLNTYATWTPQIIREFLAGSHSFTTIGLLGAIPSLFTLMAMPLISFSSDRLQERLWHTVALFALTALGWLAVVTFADASWRLAGLVLVSIGAFSGMAIFWAFATPLLSVRNRAGSIGLISSAGILGSAVSPTVVGLLRDLSASFNTGIWYAIALLMIGVVTLLAAAGIARRAG